MLYNQFSSVTHSCPTLCDPMDCITPVFPVHHQLPELTQTHGHWAGDAIQPSHPLLVPSPPVFNRSWYQIRASSSDSVLGIRWPKYWSFSFSISPSNEYSGLISFRMDSLTSFRMVGFPYSPRDSQESSPTPQLKNTNSLVLTLLYSPTLTSTHDYWKNLSFD